MADDLLKLLERYVPRVEHDQALDMINEVTEDNKKLAAEVKRLSTRETERGIKANRSAFDRMADELRVSADFRDEVYELSGLAGEKGELETAAMKDKLSKFLEAKSKFVAKEPPAPKPKQPPPPTKSTVEPKPTPKPTEADKIAKRDNEFDYSHSNLSDPDWLLVHGDAFAAAMIAGKANRISD